MKRGFDSASLLEALDTLGAAAVAHDTRLDLAVYGGSALMLASNFRFATEDVDIAEIGERPAWLDALVAEIAARIWWSRIGLVGGLAERGRRRPPQAARRNGSRPPRVTQGMTHNFMSRRPTFFD